MDLSGTERQLCQYIEHQADAMLDELAEHVAIPTGGESAPGLDRYRGLLVERLAALKAEVGEIPGDPRPTWLDLPSETVADPADPPPTALAERRIRTDGPRVLLVGHLDTVHDPDGPFRKLSVHRDKGIATGPGCVDMKGGLLIAMTALEALAEVGVDLNWTVALNSDEETGSFHSGKALRELAGEHDVGIVLEPALPDGGVVIERLGSGQFKIEVFGRAAHAGRDFSDGISAVTKLGEILVALSKLVDHKRGMIVNVGPIQGGDVTNTVPAYAACWGNVRYANAKGAEALARKIDGLATSGETFARVVVHRSWNRPAKPPTNPVRVLAESARAVAEDLGQVLPMGTSGGVCDGNLLQDAGLPTIDSMGVCGGNLHRDDEFVEIASLVERCQLLAVLLARLADGRVRVDR
jgi:glutamate carboxypeptidase